MERDDEPAGARFLRELNPTSPILVPEAEVDRKVHAMANRLRQEWSANVDRRAIEAVESAAEKALVHSEVAVRTSHRRWMTILLVLFGLALAEAAQWIYSSTNRERIERLERAADERKPP